MWTHGFEIPPPPAPRKLSDPSAKGFILRQCSWRTWWGRLLISGQKGSWERKAESSWDHHITYILPRRHAPVQYNFLSLNCTSMNSLCFRAFRRLTGLKLKHTVQHRESGFPSGLLWIFFKLPNYLPIDIYSETNHQLPVSYTHLTLPTTTRV